MRAWQTPKTGDEKKVCQARPSLAEGAGQVRCVRPHRIEGVSLRGTREKGEVMPRLSKESKTELSIIKREERLIKAEKKCLNKEYGWFMKQKQRILKKEAALKERRERIEGKKED